MGTQLLNLAKTKERLEPASKSALAEFKKIGISQATVKEPDLAKLATWMGKGPTFTPAEFLLSFDGKTLHFYVKVGSNSATLSKLDFAGLPSNGQKRAVLEKLIANSAVAEKADLDKFNAKNPPPPTVEQQKQLEQQLMPLRIQMRDKQTELKKLQDEIKKLEEQMKPLLAKEKEYEELWKKN